MSAPNYRDVPRCGGPGGKVIYPTRAAAQADLPGFRRRHSGHGSVKWCAWGGHYHITKALRGGKGKGIR